MILTISKWGNSHGVRFPRELLKWLGAADGTKVEAERHKGCVMLKLVQGPRKYSLRELVKKMPKGAKPAEADWGKPAGREIW